MKFNQGWKFTRGFVEDAMSPNYPISELEKWENVTLPHSLRLEKYCNSGKNGIYMGDGTYVKHFTVPNEYSGKKVFLRFEAVMGKSDVFVNGVKMTTKIAEKTGEKTMYGGFLPFVIDITDAISFGFDNVVSVHEDSRFDREVPPGKDPDELDFSYFGGIYRDVTMRICDKLHITDANFEDIVCGGGVLVDVEEANADRATLLIKTHVRNETFEFKNVHIKSIILDETGTPVSISQSEDVEIYPCADYTFEERVVVEKPPLWSLENPLLVDLISEVVDGGEVRDEVHTRIGIRKIEMHRDFGLKINGEIAPMLNGVNRHQEYAYIGYAGPQNLQRKDAIKLKECGVNVVRTAHYPPSPHFLDACDELGILVIEPTPGWQFFNESEIFKSRVMTDIRQMVRRDRNHPSILAYETVLNETKVPSGFTLSMAKCAKEEHPSAKVATEHSVPDGEVDNISDIIYIDSLKSEKAVVFTREYGDSYREQYAKENFFCRRAFRGNDKDYCYYPGGEGAMFLQSVKRLMGNQNDTPYYCRKDAESGNLGGSSGSGRSYLRIVEDYVDRQKNGKKHYIGGTSWLGIDHNRTYSKDMSACGILDLLRLPKFSYYAMQSQRPREKSAFLSENRIDNSYMLYIASFWTEKAPLYDKSNESFDRIGTDDERIILVYSNALEVTLKVVSENGEVLFEKREKPMSNNRRNLIQAPFQFLNVPYVRGSHLEAEGFDEVGTRVAENAVYTSGEPYKAEISVDTHGLPIIADGSDTVMLYGYITDRRGVLCEGATRVMKFTVIEGDCHIVGDGFSRVGANPCTTEAGAFGVYLKIGKTPSKIRVKLESDGLKPSEIVFNSEPSFEEECPYREIAFCGVISDEETEKSVEAKERVNFALGKPTFATSTVDGSKPEYATDGKTATVWIGDEVGQGKDSRPQSITVDLEEEKPISAVTVGLLNDSITYKYNVEVSSDGENFKVVKTTEKTGQASEVDDRFEVVSARYVRITFLEIEEDRARGQFSNATVTELKCYKI